MPSSNANKPSPEVKPRYLYIYQFADGAIYVGLTVNYMNRVAGHKSKGRISGRVKAMNHKIRRSTKAYDQAVAVRWEMRIINYLRSKGLSVLNTMLGGSIGTVRRYTYDECVTESRKHLTRTHFEQACPKLYHAARRYGWLDEIWKDVPLRKRRPGHWTPEACRAEALKYKDRREFKLAAWGAYTKALKGGFLDEITTHMPKRNSKKRSDRGKPRQRN